MARENIYNFEDLQDIYSENNKAYDLSVAQKEANYFPIHQIEKIDDTGHEMIYFKWNSVYPKAMAYLNSL